MDSDLNVNLDNYMLKQNTELKSFLQELLKEFPTLIKDVMRYGKTEIEAQFYSRITLKKKRTKRSILIVPAMNISIIMTFSLMIIEDIPCSFTSSSIHCKLWVAIKSPESEQIYN